jgi:four helix bundle protein
MASFKKFEEIIAWQKARTLYQHICKHTDEGTLKNHFSLKDQIERSSGSVMDNIAKGFGRMGNGELVHFLTITLGSAREVQSQLYRCLEKNILIKLYSMNYIILRKKYAAWLRL